MEKKKQRDIALTKQALLSATKELMTACEDCDSVTSREIASRAGVNLAMVNYCFGSREALLYEVFKLLLIEAQRVSPELARLMTADITPKERVILTHLNMMRLMIANYSYSRAVTKYILLGRNNEMGMETLPCVTAHFAGRKSDDECRLITYELTSLHELAVLRYKELKELCGIDLTDDKVLENYVRETVERFLD